MKTSSISNKLIASYLSFGVFTVIIISVIFYQTFKNALIKRTTEQLSSINVLKKIQLEDYLDGRNNIAVLLQNPLFNQTLDMFDRSSTFTTAEKKKEVSEKLEQLMNEQHYTNLALLNEKDSIIYTSNKNNILLNKYFKTSEITNFINKSRNTSTIIDLTNTTPEKKITLLIGTPIYNEAGQKKGIALLEKDIDFVNYILREHTGMGNTGETYIVGKDFTMRSQSRFLPNTFPASIKVKTTASALAFSGINGKGELIDYRGEKVVSVYNKLNIKGLDWVIISEIDMGEAMKPVYEIRNYIFWMGIAVSCLIVIITIVLSKKISQPILSLHKIVLDLAKGILPARKLTSNTNDEIGQITAALNELIEALKLTSNFANQIGHGNLNTEFKPLSEYDELGNALLQMRIDLKRLNEERFQLMKQRSIALLEGQEKERKRMARELHDGIGQMLTAIRLKINSIDQEQETKTALKKMLDDTTNEIKRISRNLMPNVLIDFGLKAAIDELIENTLKYSSAPIDYSYTEKNNLKKLNFDIEVSIYRVVQEALNNCFQYADATRIELKITVSENNLNVFIHDNGKGFDIKRSDEKKFNGIKNMKERVHLLNGQFEISSETGKGTTISIIIPID